MLKRQHHRMVYETREVMEEADQRQLERVLDALSSLGPVVRSAKSSWYKPDFEIQVARDVPPPQNLVRLSELSAAVKGLAPSNKQMVYVPYERAAEARAVVQGIHAN